MGIVQNVWENCHNIIPIVNWSIHCYANHVHGIAWIIPDSVVGNGLNRSYIRETFPHIAKSYD